MLIHRSQLLASAACTGDDARYFLNGIAVLPDGTTAGTNGHWLIQLKNTEPMPPEDMPKSLSEYAKAEPDGKATILPLEDVKRLFAVTKPSRNNIPCLQQIAVKPTNGEAGAARATDLSVTVEAKAIDGQFPMIARVIPTPQDDDIVVAYDANYLKAIADAALKFASANGKDTKRTVRITLRLRASKPNYSPGRFESADGNFLAVLMPVRM